MNEIERKKREESAELRRRIKEALSGEPRTTMDKLFAPFDGLCRWLGRWIGYFEPKYLEYRLFDEDFQPETSDERGNFIPVRLSLMVERLLEPHKGDAEEYRKRSDFATIGAARFHYDVYELQEKLRKSFAPFDPDADVLYEREFTEEEKRERLREFSEGLEEALTGCNYVEIPRQAIGRLLNISLPDALPVKANYDAFVEYRVFARGVVDKPIETKPPWRAYGQTLAVSSQTLSRVCVFARLKREKSKLAKRIEKVRKLMRKHIYAEGKADEKTDEILIVKLFKDVDLENLKMVSPKIEMRFQVADLVKIWGSFAAGSGSAIVKFALAAINPVAIAGFMFGFLLLMVRNLFKFINRRTAYMQKYANQLYFHSLASNFAAANLLTSGAEEQEIKEFVLGYFAALARGGWSTEREIDEDAEAFLKREFGLDVDFESADALRKLREKRLLEEREVLGKDWEPVKEYRVKGLDEALRALDEDWARLGRF